MIDEDSAEEKLYNDSDEDSEEEEDRVNAYDPLLVSNVFRSYGDSESDSGDIGDKDYVPRWPQAAQKRQVLAPVELFLLCLYVGGVEVGVWWGVEVEVGVWGDVERLQEGGGADKHRCLSVLQFDTGKLLNVKHPIHTCSMLPQGCGATLGILFWVWWPVFAVVVFCLCIVCFSRIYIFIS